MSIPTGDMTPEQQQALAKHIVEYYNIAVQYENTVLSKQCIDAIVRGVAGLYHRMDKENIMASGPIISDGVRHFIATRDRTLLDREIEHAHNTLYAIVQTILAVAYMEGYKHGQGNTSTPGDTPVSKPRMKRQLAIRLAVADHRHIILDCVPDLLGDLSEFGFVGPLPGHRYSLFVDARFDFEEVLRYIKSLGVE